MHRPGSSIRNQSSSSNFTFPPKNQRDHQLESPLSPHNSSSRSSHHGSTVSSDHVPPRVDFNGIRNVPTGPSSMLSRPTPSVERAAPNTERAQQQPHIFMPASCLPVLESHIVKHLMGFFRDHKPLEIQMDEDGWYLIFESTRSGLTRLNHCYQDFNGQLFFSQYRLSMRCFPGGQQKMQRDRFDDRQRSPSPRAARVELPTSALNVSLSPQERVNRRLPNTDSANQIIRKPLLPAAPVDGTVPKPAQHVTTQESNPDTTDAMDISSLDPNSTLIYRTSICSDRDETSSVFSGTTHSDGSRSKTRRCYVCKHDAAYRGGLIKCSTCSKRYHRSCTRGASTAFALSAMDSWRCSSCVKKDGTTAETSVPDVANGASISAPERESVAKATAPAAPSVLRLEAVKAPVKDLDRRQAMVPSSDAPMPTLKPLSPSIMKASAAANASTVEFNSPSIVEASLDNVVTSLENVEASLDTVEAFPDPEADDLVAQSFAESLNSATKTPTPLKTGKLKLTRTKLKPTMSTAPDTHENVGTEEQGISVPQNQPTSYAISSSTPAVTATRTEPTAEKHGDGVPKMPQNLLTATSSTGIDTTLKSSNMALPQHILPVVPTAADLRALGRNKVLKVKAAIEKDLVKQGIIGLVSKETAQLESPRVDGHEHGYHIAEKSNMKPTETSRKMLGAGAITSLEESRVVPAAGWEPQIPQLSDSQEVANQANIASTDTPSKMAYKAPELSATETCEPLRIEKQLPETPPLTKPKMVKRRGLNIFTLLPCSVCDTKFSFPLSAGPSPTCKSCKKKAEADAVVQSEFLATPVNEDVVMQDAPSLDDPSAMVVLADQQSHIESQTSAGDANTTDQASAQDQARMSAIDEDHEAESGLAVPDDDATPKGRGLLRKSCDSCYQKHVKCTHHVEKFSERQIEQTAAPTAELVGGDGTEPANGAEQDDDPGTAAASIQDTPDTSFASTEKQSKSRTKKPKRKDKPAPSADDDEASPATATLYSDWSDEKLQRMIAELGDSFKRPVGSRMKLVGMAMCSSRDYRLQTVEVYRWVAANFPMYKRKQGNWENMLAAQMTQGKDTDNGTGHWHMVEWKEGDGGKGTGAWYELLPHRKDEMWRWDPVLKEPVAPQRSPQHGKDGSLKVKKVRRKGSSGLMILTQGASANSTPISTPSRKVSRKTASSYGGGLRQQMAAGRRASGLSTPLDPDDAMDIDDTPADGPEVGLGAGKHKPRAGPQRNIASNGDDSSSDEEPIANMRRKAPSLQPRLTPTAFMQPRPHRGRDETPRANTAEDAKAAPETLALTQSRSPRMDEATRRSLAQLLKLEALNLDYTAPSLFDEWPEQHPDTMFTTEIEREAKQAEIRNRPTRKQLFGKPASHSRVHLPEPAILDESPVKRNFLSPEKRSRAIVDARPDDPYEWESSSFDPTRKKFSKLDEFFDMPGEPIPIMSKGHLAFRDGTRTEYGRLPRAKAVFKAGFDA
jgi:hypothetical protein